MDSASLLPRRATSVRREPHLVMLGQSLKAVQELLGYESIEMTFGTRT